MMHKDNNAYANYLRDLGSIIKEMALEAKQSAIKSDKTPEYDVEVGRLLALQDVVSMMQEQAVTFGITLRDISLEDIDPYEDLKLLQP